MSYKPLYARLTQDESDWLERHSYETGLSKAEIMRRALALYREREVKKMITLQDLTGRESGLVIYGNTGILCNWASIEGLPMIGPSGLLGTGESVPGVAGAHVDDLAPYLEGMDVTNMTSGDGEITGGTVYELGDDVLVITPDGWI